MFFEQILVRLPCGYPSKVVILEDCRRGQDSDLRELMMDDFVIIKLFKLLSWALSLLYLSMLQVKSQRNPTL